MKVIVGGKLLELGLVSVKALVAFIYYYYFIVIINLSFGECAVKLNPTVSQNFLQTAKTDFNLIKHHS